MTDLISMRERPPRIENRHPAWARALCIGLLIDWLDSRPESSAKNDAALKHKAMRGGDMVALAAAVITKRIGLEWANFDGHVDHTIDYNVDYHAQVAGHLAVDEISFGDDTYRRLNDVVPGCMSALVNLAEIERRAGLETEAQVLLQAALNRAESSTGQRYGVADSAWRLEIRCALARLARELGDGGPLLASAHREKLAALITQLQQYGSWEKAAIPAHQAFSVASTEQRIVLHAAMRLAPIRPKPPAAAHADFAAIAAVETLVQQHAQKDATVSPPIPGKPGPVASVILSVLRRLRPP
jgi:hypothetical protein